MGAPEPSSGRGTTAPDAAKVTAAAERYLSNILSPAVSQVRAVLVNVDNKPVMQRYRGSTAQTTRDVHSVTKSVMATLIGIAIAEGRLRSLDDPLAVLLARHTADMNPATAAVTLRQLLTMTAGLPGDPDGGGLDASLSGPDWVGSVLRRGTVTPPGSAFVYASGGSHLLAAILVDAVGTSVREYARPRLFDPLGIDTSNAVQPRVDVDPDAQAKYVQAAFAWPTDPAGIELGYGGLKLAAVNMAKIGQLYLDGGRWNGQQLVPASWVRDATRAHVATEAGAIGGLTGYGYQWWVTTDQDHPGYAALGFGGQLIEVIPDLRLVVVVATATAVTDSELNTGLLPGLVADAIVPALTG